MKGAVDLLYPAWLVAVEQEFNRLRGIIAALKTAMATAPAPVPVPTPTAEKSAEVRKLASAEQAEADLLRVTWMGAIGHSAADIEASLRFNHPESVAEEQELLNVVRIQLEWERQFTAALWHLGYWGELGCDRRPRPGMLASSSVENARRTDSRKSRPGPHQEFRRCLGT